jgi:signal transduction histidine kinase
MFFKQNISKIILALLLVLTIALVVFYRQASLQNIREISRHHNEELAKTFIYSLWPRFETILERKALVSADDYSGDTELAIISSQVLALVKDTPVLKIKLYGLDGRVLYSSDPSEIGFDDSANPRLNRSLSGETLTIFRDHPDFQLFDRTIKGRELMVSYVPLIDDEAGARVRAVFELYYDMAPTLKHSRLVTVIIFAFVLTFALFVGGVYFLFLRPGNSSDFIDEGRILFVTTERTASTNFYLILVSFLLAALIFVFDIFLPLGVAAGVPYVALVLIGMWHSNRQVILALAVVGSLLTIAGYFLSTSSGIQWMVFTNRILALFAIWITAVLAYRTKAQSDRIINELAKIPEQNPAPVFKVSGDGMLIYANKAGLNFRSFWDCDVGQKLPDDWCQMISDILESDQVRVMECEFLGLHYLLNIKPVQSDGFVNIYAIDITDQKQAEGRLRKAVNDAELANRTKSEFLASTGHELRTPLNAIIGFSSMMKAEMFGPLNKKYTEYCSDINNSGEHLLQLINDILDISAIGAGKLDIQEENLDVGNIIEATLPMVSSRADEGNIQLTCNVDDDLPMLYADKRKLTQIILNLLSNAIKFTLPDGEVSIVASLDDGGAQVLTVTDTGIGMDGVELVKAMTEFGQVDSGLDRKHEGVGLGLSLAKGLIKLHGGTLEIESKKGRGTSISVRFPPERTVTSRERSAL